MRRLFRSELVEEDVEPEAVCSEQAADSDESLSSLDDVIGNIVSCGENFSVTALKWTVTRASCEYQRIPVTCLSKIFETHLAPVLNNLPGHILSEHFAYDTVGIQIEEILPYIVLSHSVFPEYLHCPVRADQLRLVIYISAETYQLAMSILLHLFGAGS
jgi:hypothetical protein